MVQGSLFEDGHSEHKHDRLLRRRTKLEDYNGKVARVLRLYQPSNCKVLSGQWIRGGIKSLQRHAVDRVRPFLRNKLSNFK
ncbi:MAG: hypothetical protein LAP85_29210 [Acidobacteriia bacterium]|nr:hypothetical protein [Terriglobia bacterium]